MVNNKFHYKMCEFDKNYFRHLKIVRVFYKLVKKQ